MENGQKKERKKRKKMKKPKRKKEKKKKEKREKKSPFPQFCSFSNHRKKLSNRFYNRSLQQWSSFISRPVLIIEIRTSKVAISMVFVHENYIRHWRLFFPLYSDEQLTEKRLGDWLNWCLSVVVPCRLKAPKLLRSYFDRIYYFFCASLREIILISVPPRVI